MRLVGANKDENEELSSIPCARAQQQHAMEDRRR